MFEAMFEAMVEAMVETCQLMHVDCQQSMTAHVAMTAMHHHHQDDICTWDWLNGPKSPAISSEAIMLVFTAELTKGKVPIRCSRPLEACTFSCRTVELPTCRLPELWNTCRSHHEVQVASNVESE